MFVQKYYTGIINETFTKHLREMLFARQLSQSLTDFQQKPAGNYLMRYSGDMSSITKYISTGVMVLPAMYFFMVVALRIGIYECNTHYNYSNRNYYRSINLFWLWVIDKKHFCSKTKSKIGITQFCFYTTTLVLYYKSPQQANARSE
ncbi:MAG: ABC transporter ATP-binding protein [Bacteroidetes bacterium]|nr:ABC transporter ATP-binding protein [Bacteroidota bacterium]